MDFTADDSNSYELSSDPEDYVYAVIEEKVVHIVPKDNLHWDKHISNVLYLPGEFYEKSEARFSYEDITFDQAKALLDEIGIEHSEELQKLIDE